MSELVGSKLKLQVQNERGSCAESTTEDVLTLSKLKSKVKSTRLMLNQNIIGTTEVLPSGATEESGFSQHEREEEHVYGEFCEGDIDLGRSSARTLDGSSQTVEFLPSDLLTDIHMKNNEKPVAKVSQSDLEEASESKFGKTIANSYCTQGARQNAPTENALLKAHSSTSLGKGNISYLGVVTKNGPKGKTQNFSGKSLMKLEYTPYKRVDGVPTISITPELDAMENWGKCIVGYFIGAKLPFQIVKREVLKKWSGEGLQKMAYTVNGFYLLDFVDEEARDKILENGPIHIFGRVMVLKKWHLMMSLSKETCDNIPIWVNFHNLPYEFWSGKSLGKIASVVGKPLYADQATEHLTRVTYARVCIEVDAKEEKVETIRVENDGQSVDVGVKYQWYPLRCGDCKVFGHSISSCPVKAKQKEVLVRANDVEAQVNNIPRKQGTWKEVRRGKNESNSREVTRDPSLILRNSFDIMMECEDSEITNDLENKMHQPRGVAIDRSREAKQKLKTQHIAAVSAKVQKLFAQPAFSDVNSSGLLGSDEIFGSGCLPNPGVIEGKERKMTEKSKMKDRKGNVLPLKEVKKLSGDSEEVEVPSSNACSDEVIGPVSNPEIDVSLFDAFGTKEEGDSDMSSPIHGLSISDYPSDWSKGRVRKAIKAMKLAGPPKTKEDPP